MACVPQAFWIVCAAKKRPCSEAAVWSYVPSAGAVLLRDCPPIHLKRKMTPYTGLFCSVSPGAVVDGETNLRERIVSASREMSSSNCTPLMPRFSINEVKTPWVRIKLDVVR